MYYTILLKYILISKTHKPMMQIQNAVSNSVVNGVL